MKRIDNQEMFYLFDLKNGIPYKSHEWFDIGGNREMYYLSVLYIFVSMSHMGDFIPPEKNHFLNLYTNTYEILVNRPSSEVLARIS